MDWPSTVKKAAAAAGSQAALAKRLHTQQSRISEWMRRTREPNPAEFLVTAQIAGIHDPRELLEAANDSRINKRECLF